MKQHQFHHDYQQFDISIHTNQKHKLKIDVMKCILVFTILIVAAVADNPPPAYQPAPTPAYKPAPAPSYKPAPSYQEPSYADVPASYSYQWAVKDDYSGNNYGQQESRNDKSTVGSYYVLLPDGRTQKVTYTVDAYGGYDAEV